MCFLDKVQFYFFEVVARPQWDGSSPVAIPWDGPITSFAQPVAKPLLFHEIRNPAHGKTHNLQHSTRVWICAIKCLLPVSGSIACKQIFLHLLDSHEPTWNCAVDERSVRSKTRKLLLNNQENRDDFNSDWSVLHTANRKGSYGSWFLGERDAR